MSCRLDCRQAKTGYHYYLEYSDWGVALAGVNQRPGAGRPGARSSATGDAVGPVTL